MTTQSSQFGEMRNAEVSGCVLTHGNSPIEFWTNYYIDEEGKRHGYIDGLHVFDNVMAYTGYHFGHQRPVKNASFFCIGVLLFNRIEKNFMDTV